MAEETP